MRRPATLVTLVAVALGLGISGPFGTYEHFTLLPRLAYWLVTVGLTFSSGYFCGAVASILMARRFGYFVTVPVVGFASGLPVIAVVMLVSLLVSPALFADPVAALKLALYCIAISTGIAAVFAAFAASHETRPAHHGPPKLLQRLPVGERGDLYSLSVSDHYVEVVTSRGKSLVLMRLSDAIAEADGVAGVQIHRSHWVALDAVRRIHRSGGRVTVETKSGARLPVSRGFLPATRAAGLLT